MEVSGFPTIRTLNFYGSVTKVVSPTVIQTSLTGYRDSFFQNWYVNVVWQSGGAGASPQGDYILCTAYLGLNGEITLKRPPSGAAFTVGDLIYVIHPSQVGNLYVVTQPSDNVKEQSNTEVNTTVIVYTKVKELAFTGNVGGPG
jgi:hypothetical protein